MATLLVVLLAALRIVQFTGGAAYITTESGGVEHVVMKDAKGAVEAESECDAQSGTYEQSVKFQQAIVAAARDNNRAAMVSLVQYPLRVNVKTKPLFIKDAATLNARYATVFTQGVIGQIQQANPHEVFCRNGMSMLGSGIIWATVDKHGVLKAAVINQ